MSNKLVETCGQTNFLVMPFSSKNVELVWAIFKCEVSMLLLQWITANTNYMIGLKVNNKNELVLYFNKILLTIKLSRQNVWNLISVQFMYISSTLNHISSHYFVWSNLVAGSTWRWPSLDVNSTLTSFPSLMRLFTVCFPCMWIMIFISFG